MEKSPNFLKSLEKMSLEIFFRRLFNKRTFFHRTFLVWNFRTFFRKLYFQGLFWRLPLYLHLNKYIINYNTNNLTLKQSHTFSSLYYSVNFNKIKNLRFLKYWYPDDHILPWGSYVMFHKKYFGIQYSVS